MSCVRCGSQLRGDGPCPRCLLTHASPTFAGLELLEPIGEGGMGTVFKARHVKLDRFVAVKFLSRALGDVPELKERFTLEARALAKVKHPNVVQVFDAGEEDGETWLVMELVEGGTLASRLPLEPRDAVRVTSAVCRALQAVHEAGLVHRDVKPENVLVTSSGEVKLSDFGIVRETAATRAGAPVGTPGFVAPEVLAGHPATPSADVFALGVMLRQLVTGRAPGSADEPALPGGLDAIVRRATAPILEARFESAREFESALSQVTLEEAGALPADEQLWSRAVAVSMTVAFAALAWAGIASLTPRVHAAGDVPPLVALGTRALSDGRLYTVARFETGWILAAAALFGVALAAVGALRQHWRRVGLTTARPSGSLPFARATFFAGALALSLYLARLAFAPHGSLSPYIPLAGGTVVLAVMYFGSLARLEAWRLGRSILREPEWVLGVIAGAVPPVVDGLRQMVERAVP
ncbi:MAG: serine/threonine-protein kinase [Myxococcales bacterium]|nr:serine/threonine-protein kinase [Myxococcales bacterium]